MSESTASEVEFILPLKTVNELNDHSHWRKRQKRAKQQHHVVSLVVATLRKPRVPCVVELTRISPGRLDSDGAVASQKHVRDAIAKWIGVDDKHDDIVEYRVSQEHGKEYGVRVRVRSREREAV